MKRGHIIAIVVFLVFLGLIFSLSPRRMQSLQGAFLGVISPFLGTGSALQQKVTEFRSGLKTLQQLEEENRRIKIENSNLKATNQLLRDLAEENKRLRAALNYQERSFFELLPARIISRDSSTWWNTVKINRGSDHGIKRDMAVLTEDGLVGKTTTVGKDVTVVLLITDETCKVAVKVEGTNEQGILSGERVVAYQAPQLRLKFLTRDANLQPGQNVFSSGLGGVFPSQVPVGVVKSFESKELEGEAVVTPIVDLTGIQDVFVVLEMKE